MLQWYVIFMSWGIRGVLEAVPLQIRNGGLGQTES